MAALIALAPTTVAFWLAFVGIVRARPSDGLRALCALSLGALACHGIWCLQVGMAWGDWGWLDVTSGATLLGLPVGFVLCGPWGRGRVACCDFWAAAARALLPALVAARLGCWLSGCCLGALLAEPFVGKSLIVLRHPVALYEVACWLGLRPLLSRLGRDAVGPVFLLCFGLARWGTAPWRAPAPESLILSSECLASVWVMAGLAGLWALPRGAAGRMSGPRVRVGAAGLLVLAGLSITGCGAGFGEDHSNRQAIRFLAREADSLNRSGQHDAAARLMREIYRNAPHRRHAEQLAWIENDRLLAGPVAATGDAECLPRVRLIPPSRGGGENAIIEIERGECWECEEHGECGGRGTWGYAVVRGSRDPLALLEFGAAAEAPRVHRLTLPDWVAPAGPGPMTLALAFAELAGPRGYSRGWSWTLHAVSERRPDRP